MVVVKGQSFCVTFVKVYFDVLCCVCVSVACRLISVASAGCQPPFVFDDCLKSVNYVPPHVKLEMKSFQFQLLTNEQCLIDSSSTHLSCTFPHIPSNTYKDTYKDTYLVRKSFTGCTKTNLPLKVQENFLTETISR